MYQVRRRFRWLCASAAAQVLIPRAEVHGLLQYDGRSPFRLNRPGDVR